MPQSKPRDPKDRYDARNPGVAPYAGITDSEVEAEEAARRSRDQSQGIFNGLSVTGNAAVAGAVRDVETRLRLQSGRDSEQRSAERYRADKPRWLQHQRRRARAAK